MKKTFLPILAALLLTSCNGLFKANANETDADSIAAMSIDEFDEDNENYEEGEADSTEMMGLAPYEEDILDIDELPPSADSQDSYFQTHLYVNVEQEPEDGLPGTYSVWLADERAGTVRKVLTTNPTAAAMWDEMKKKDSDAVDVPIHLVATAEKAYLVPGDFSKIIVEGCPDGRNTWTYIIDTQKRTAKQFPSNEGVQSIDYEKKEIILASYGYNPAPDYGRYTYNRAYSVDGKFLRQTSEPETE